MVARPLVQRQSNGRQTGDRESRQTHSGHRWRNLVYAQSQDRSSFEPQAKGIPTQSIETNLHTQAERKAKTAGYSHHDRPGHASAIQTCPGSSRRNTGRPELLWISTVTQYPGCNRTLFLLPVQENICEMDSGRGYSELFQPDQPQMAVGIYSNGQRGSGQMAKSRICRKRTTLSD